jgi:predicted nuclease with TOPRIM domain
MDATTITLLALLGSALFAITGFSFTAQFQQRADAGQLRLELSGRLDAQTVRIDGLTSAVSHLNGQVRDLNGQVRDLNGQVSHLNGQVGDLHGQVSDLHGQVSGLNGRFDSHLREHQSA